LIHRKKTLLKLREEGVQFISFDLEGGGGFWHKKGAPLPIKSTSSASVKSKKNGSPSEASSASAEGVPESSVPKAIPPLYPSKIEKRLQEIIDVKKEAHQKYQLAKKCIKKVITDIKTRNGELDYQQVEETVSDLFDFVSSNHHSFSYLTREIFSFDDYLYNHSINVCTIGTVVLQRFNRRLPAVDSDLFKAPGKAGLQQEYAHAPVPSFHYRSREMRDICIGFFLHDIGKVLIPDQVLNKQGKLTPEEFRIVQGHSYDKGAKLLQKNHIENAFIQNIVKYHHAALYENEAHCYPADKSFMDIPAYVMICKFSDIYDAMTSKRCYKEAFNPIKVVTRIFRNYAHKGPHLQMALYTFVKSIGICPAGSVVTLINGQKAFVLESNGPLVLPFTNAEGDTLSKHLEPIDLGEKDSIRGEVKIDNSKPLLSPRNAYDILPAFLKAIVRQEQDG
jgi:HD-GYP domain-containing protein (c-di-GMP phosphodiesterase class II)